MKIVNFKNILPALLLLGVIAGNSHAEEYDIPRVDPEGDKTFFLSVVEEMRANGADWPGILLRLVRSGLTLPDAAYVSALIEPDKGDEIYEDAVDLLSSVPEWVCDEDGLLEQEYTPEEEHSANLVCKSNPEMTSCIVRIRDAAIIGSGRMDLFPAAGGCSSNVPPVPVVAPVGRGPVTDTPVSPN